MNSVTLSTQITIDDIINALQRVPSKRLPDILQFIEFIEYQATLIEDDSSEDAALWAAVEAEQAYRREHPEDVIVCHSMDELKAVLNSAE
jgi:hypothetical protein